MREQLIQYVKLLFAGTPDSEDMQQEILQNTLDRYDDLIDQGKSPEAAYRLAISGIGDINEILGAVSPASAAAPIASTPEQTPDKGNKKLMRAVAIGMYICSAIPLFLLGNIGDGVIGLSITCLLVAAATALIIMSSTGDSEDKKKQEEAKAPLTPKQELRQAVQKTLSTVALVLFLVISFITGAWHITWLIFPIMGAVRGIVFACMDLKEANNNET